MQPISDLTGPQRDFLTSYFKSIFHEDAEFAEADEATFVAELSTTEFSDADTVHGRIANIAKTLQAKGLLAEVQSDPAESGRFLTVQFNENTARTIFALVQDTKSEGTFYDLAQLLPPGGVAP